MTSHRSPASLTGQSVCALALIAAAGLSACVEDGSAAIDAGSPAPTERERRSTLWAGWMGLWNGDFSAADALISPDFRIHVTLLDGSSDAALRGPSGLTGWIAQTRQLFPDIVFATVVGPLIDGDHLSGHWTATGTYAGGFPGATAKPGTVVTFTGTDVLRVNGDRVLEYWLVSDTLKLMMDLGVGAP